MKTLVVHTGGIGDFLLACPALQALSSTSRITLAGYEDRLALAVAGGIAQRTVSLDAIDFHSVFSVPSDRLIAFLAEFDRIIVWMRDDDGAIRSGLGAVYSGEVNIFPGLPPDGWSEHASRYFRGCLGFDELSEFQLDIATSGNGYDVVIHPGSGGRKKNWSFERFRDLASLLEEQERKVTWCVGPAEEESGHCDVSKNMLRCDSLVELAGELAGAKLYIGNDSGISHLAASLGVRTVALYGATDPAVWAPLGRHVTVVGGMNEWPTFDEVVTAVG